MARTRARGARARQAEEQEEPTHPLTELVRESQHAATAQEDSDGGHAVKKRRVAGRLVVQGAHEAPHEASSPVAKEASDDDQDAAAKEAPEADHEGSDAVSSPGTPLAQQQQVTREDPSSSESEGSDWEEVDLEARAAPSPAKPAELSITLSTPEGKRSASAQTRRRAPLTAADRKLRLELHKVHVLCLLGHAALRNAWCNDSAIQEAALAALPPRAADYLRDDPTQSQFQRGRSFAEGLDMAVEAFGQRFEVSARGLCKARWAATPDHIVDLDVPDDVELPLLKDDFLDCATDMSASRDVGAQLFVAMLRALGVEARLVVSLQALPLGATHASAVEDSTRGAAPVFEHTETRTNLGPTPKKKKRRPESRFPVYWVEAFAPSHQKWHAVDPVVTRTVSKPSRLEPPLSEAQNQLAYAVAFEADGSARDVTRRYTRAYNAKTRRSRVEAFKGGEAWWAQVMQLYARRPRRRAAYRDRDAIEDAQLAQRAAQEAMPRALADFKGHPVYALQRHLRRNEVVHPRRPIGKVDSGHGTSAEDVFRRSDVHTVRSVDAWFREGREVKSDVQALSLGKPRGGLVRAADDDEEPESQPGVPLFAIFQTELYHPPPVVRGRVPRNAFGNLDVYVPSMIPPGGVHVRHPAAPKAARLLGIDHASAVTGFEFRGRTGSAVTLGAVVAEEFAEAIVTIIVGFAEEEWRERVDRRRAGLLGLWKRFLTGLRIRERVQGYAVEGEEPEEADDEDDESEDAYEPSAAESARDTSDGEGGKEEPDAAPDEEFVPPVVEITRAVFPKPEPKKKDVEHRNTHTIDIAEASGAGDGGFLPDAGGFGGQDGGGGFLPADSGGGGFTADNIDGGGFMVEDSGGGGFLPDAGAAEPKGGGFVADDTGGGFVVDQSEARLPDADSVAGSSQLDELEAAQVAQALEESAKEAAANERTMVPGGLDGPASDAAMIEDEKSTAQAYTVAEAKAEPEKKQTAHVATEDPAGEESSDKGSLLSHDPEDEDADPDWLV